MLRTRRTPRGFTLIEMAVVIAIVGVLAALAVTSLERSKPRANLTTLATDLHALLKNARSNAMLTGRDTIVMLFPSLPNPLGGTGRAVVLEDPDGTFFVSTAAVNFTNYAPSNAVVQGQMELMAARDFPPGVVVRGNLASALPAPYTRIDAGRACGFCDAGMQRGAIRFDPRGRATFFNSAGAALDLWGSSFSLQAEDGGGNAIPTGTRTIIVTGSTGSVRTFKDG